MGFCLSKVVNELRISILVTRVRWSFVNFFKTLSPFQRNMLYLFIKYQQLMHLLIALIFNLYYNTIGDKNQHRVYYRKGVCCS